VGIIDTKMTITREGRVGIGVSRPSYLLDLQDIPGGSTAGNIRFRSGFNASTYHLFRMDNTHQSASYSIYDRYGNESIKFHASETCWITGDTNGAKLGIGTSTNIDGAIHIYQPNGAIRTSGSGSIVLEHGTGGEKKSSIVFSSAANTTDYGYLEFIDEDNTYTYWGNGTSNSSLTLGCKLHDDTSNGADVVVMKGVAANIFDAENHLFMTGPVGVGVTGSLKYRLTVSTNSNDVSFANVQEQFCLAMRNINRTNNNMSTIGNFNDLDVVNSSISFQNVDQTNNYGDIVFSTRSSDNKTDAFLTERVRIQNTGKVGIGTNNPSGWLTIKNVPSSNSEKLLVFSEDNDDEFFFESGFYTVGSDKETIKLKTKWGHYAMAWSGNGNVGIGVTTPEFPLEVTYSSNYDYSWGMNIRNKDTTSTTSQRGNMIVFSDVNSIQAGLGAYRENFNTNRRSGLAFLVGDEPAGHVDYHTASTALINQSISEKMRLTPDGRLGIGTKTPETTLHVQGDSTFYGHLLPGANNTYDLGSSTKQFRHFYLSANSTFLDGTKVGYWMNLTGNEFTHQTGKVGIGTNSPNAQLHVQAAGAFSANEILQRWAYKNSSNNHRGIALTGPASDNDANPFIFTTNNALKFVVDSDDVLTLDSLGNVGIGTDNPINKLDVDG
ncbi:MAG: hypothetical protein KAR54_04710, partial [Candidatus Pacebacteria bacterium]|nr:hypothetical protein [Candidatus Paceibacterota bacterium]